METNETLKEVLDFIKELKAEIDNTPKKYYRNKHLKKFFGLSDNTISDYRDNNILPWTKLGTIYYYPIDELNQNFIKNSNFHLFHNYKK